MLNGKPVGLAAPVGDGLNLSADEQRHIRDCRAMKPEARVVIFDLSALYVKTLPAERLKVRLVRAPD
jgi:hypothetical protein